jgi:hypothetical protein
MIDFPYFSRFAVYLSSQIDGFAGWFYVGCLLCFFALCFVISALCLDRTDRTDQLCDYFLVITFAGSCPIQEGSRRSEKNQTLKLQSSTGCAFVKPLTGLGYRPKKSLTA